MVPEKNYRTNVWPDWCPGCGNYGILASLYNALEELDLEPSKTVIVSGIGCSAKIPHYVYVNGVHTLHGRAIAYATGIKLSNPELTVIVHGGDGDLLGIGMGHFIALGRRNIDVTVILHNNRVYGLTKGQASPTLPRGLKSRSMKIENLQDPVDPIALALMAGYTFIARSYAFSGKHLKEVIKKAVKHRGASFIDVLQPCATYDPIFTPTYYSEKLYNVEENGWDPIVKNIEEESEKKIELLKLLGKLRDREPIGVLYVNPHRETYCDRIDQMTKAYYEKPPAKKAIERNGKPLIDRSAFEKLFKNYIVEVRRK